MRQYVALAKKMANDYKRDAINAYITESFCPGADNQN